MTDIATDILDADVPFFPFKIDYVDDRDEYLTTNHLLDASVCLNRAGAEVLRLANGELRLLDIVDRLNDLYPEAGGPNAIRQDVRALLASLTEKELVWWRHVPAEVVRIGPPTLIFWEITAACNLRCRHCVVAAGARLKDELTTERCLSLAREMADFGVHSIAFSGGEPLVHPDFKLLVEHVYNLGMTVLVATNGTLVTPEMAAWLKSYVASIQVSLDGSTPEIHDYMRPGGKTYADTIQGIKNLVAAGHKVIVGTVVTTRNLADIPAIVRLTEAIGASAFRLIPFVPKGRGGYYANLEVAPARVKELTQWLKDERSRLHINIMPIEFEGMLDGQPCGAPPDLSRGLGCSGAESYATVTPTGELLPCHFFEGVRADSVATQPFPTVWIQSRFLNYFRHLNVGDLHGACRHCAWLTECRGSCRAVNFAKGDFLGTNLGCWVAQGMGESSENESNIGALYVG